MVRSRPLEGCWEHLLWKRVLVVSAWSYHVERGCRVVFHPFPGYAEGDHVGYEGSVDVYFYHGEVGAGERGVHDVGAVECCELFY